MFKYKKLPWTILICYGITLALKILRKFRKACKWWAGQDWLDAPMVGVYTLFERLSRWIRRLPDIFTMNLISILVTHSFCTTESFSMDCRNAFYQVVFSLYTFPLVIFSYTFVMCGERSKND